VTTTHELPTYDGPAATAPQGPSSARRVAVVAGAAAAALVAAAGVATLMHGNPPPAKPTDPLTLASTVSGLSPMPATQDLTQATTWQARAKQVAGSATLVARTYGTGDQGARSIRIVIARTDLTGKLEQAWAAPNAGTATGQNTCTNNTVLVPKGPAKVRDTVMLCWRVTPDVSGYALIIDPTAKTPVSPNDGAAALDEAWKIALG
jgi:hypothetical protein